MATHPTILAWRIPWTEEPGRLQCVGSQRIGHSPKLLSTHTCMVKKKKKKKIKLGYSYSTNVKK